MFYKQKNIQTFVFVHIHGDTQTHNSMKYSCVWDSVAKCQLIHISLRCHFKCNKK